MWERAGTAAWAAGLVASIVLLALAGALAASSRAGRLAAGVTVIAAITAIVSSGVFITQRPEVQGIEVSRGLWLYAAGIVVALGAALATLRARSDTPA